MKVALRPLPLRPLVAALRAAHPAMKGLDDVTAADLAKLSVAQRTVLDVRYLSKPGKVLTFEEIAAQLKQSRAAPYLAELGAFNALKLSGKSKTNKHSKGRRRLQPVAEQAAIGTPWAAQKREARRKRAPHYTVPAVPVVCDDAQPKRMPTPTRLAPGTTYQTIARADEAELIRRCKAGDDAAGRVLCQLHAGLIAKYALKYRGRGLDNDDLLQEGRIGFLMAVMRFNPAVGAKLSTFAWWWIQHEAERAVLATGQPIRLPVSVEHKLRAAKRHGVELTPSALAEARIMNAGRAAEVLAAKQIMSFDAPLGGEDATLHDFTQSTDQGPEAAYAEAEQNQGSEARVESLLACLDERERTVVMSRLMADEGEDQTFGTLGEQFGVSRERVRQLQVQAYRKMRARARRLTADGSPVT